MLVKLTGYQWPEMEGSGRFVLSIDVLTLVCHLSVLSCFSQCENIKVIIYKFLGMMLQRLK